MITGEELAKLRHTHGFTQSQLAEYLGYTVKGKPNKSMIARFENNHASINSRIGLLIKTYFGRFHDDEVQKIK